ncbi:winged helix-turn-helix domain-containing protein [Sphingomonas sp. PB4P5]|uniref:winged helix-turn-helix domain-containing protein n=1 Tax=Parasphingomonas puruogangriensis TaxID=3096155 RepID=UPI002FC9455D
MARADRGDYGWAAMRRYASEGRAEAQAILERIRTDGPLAASDFEHGKSSTGWWAWGETKRALEWLFWAGHITTATRRRSFERVYDLTERVIPPHILALPTPSEEDAHRALVERAATAMGVATETDLRDYFRLGVVETRTAITELVEHGILLPTRITGWPKTAYLHRDARRPRRIEGAALLAPFDPLIWERDRAERLFGFHYRIEIYVPAEKRVHGYYVLPLLLDDALVARVDLKADRQNGRLLAQSIHLEPNAPPQTRERLEGELERMAAWLELERVKGIATLL